MEKTTINDIAVAKDDLNQVESAETTNRVDDADYPHNVSKRVNIKIRGRRYSIPFEDIVYFEKNLRKIDMHTKRGVLSYYGRFCDLMPLLDSRFAFCHKSYVLNIDEILCFSREAIVMSSGDTIRFGQKCFGRLRDAYEAHTGISYMGDLGLQAVADCNADYNAERSDDPDNSDSSDAHTE